jgi:hypothetical protein
MLASQAYSIDVEDQAKVMTVKFYYQATSGASNCNFSGTSSNSFAWAVYDVTNSSWLTSAGNFNLVQSSGCGYVTGTCQTNSNTSQLRLVVYNANATSGAATITLDGFYVGPQTAPSGPAMTDWVAYTPTFTGLGTPTGVSFYSRRVGDSLQVYGTFTPGSATATQAQITLGFNGTNNNVTIDSTKIGTNSLVGEAEQAEAASSYFGTTVLATGGNGYFLFGTKTSTSNGLSPSNGSVLSNGVAISFFATVPIAGWSSNSSMSADTDTRVVAASYGITTGASTTANTPFNYDTKIIDTHAAVTTGAGVWKFTAPVSGIYSVSDTAYSYGGGSADIYVYKNGVKQQYINDMVNGTVTSGSTLIQLNAGDYISLNPGSTATPFSSTAPNFVNMISINRLSGPAVVTATESVNGRYFSSTTSISGSLATIVYATKGWDTHGAYNSSTGIWTAPVSGKYQFNCALATAGTLALNGVIDMQVQQSGSSSQISEDKIYAGGVQTAITAGVSDEFYCLAGDTIKVQVSSSATSPSIVSSNNQNYFSWSRIGN